MAASGPLTGLSHGRVDSLLSAQLSIEGRGLQCPLHVDTGHCEPSGASSVIRPIEASEVAIRNGCFTSTPAVRCAPNALKNSEISDRENLVFARVGSSRPIVLTAGRMGGRTRQNRSVRRTPKEYSVEAANSLLNCDRRGKSSISTKFAKSDHSRERGCMARQQ